MALRRGPYSLAVIEKRHTGFLASAHHLVAVKARIGPQRELAARPRRSYPVEHLCHEAGRAPGRMRIAAPLAHPEHLPAARGGRQERVEPPHGGVTKARPFFFEAVGLANTRVDVDGERACRPARPPLPMPFSTAPRLLCPSCGHRRRKNYAGKCRASKGPAPRSRGARLPAPNAARRHRRSSHRPPAPTPPGPLPFGPGWHARGHRPGQRCRPPARTGPAVRQRHRQHQPAIGHRVTVVENHLQGRPTCAMIVASKRCLRSWG